MQEIELKILLDEAAEKRLRRVAAQSGLPASRAVTQKLRTIYYDTEQGSLAAARIALRLRKKGGKWEQTVKIGRRMDGGLSRTVEFTTPIRDSQLDLSYIKDDALRDEIAGLGAEGTLAPVYESEIRRSTRLIEPAPGAEVELAIDTGVLRAGARVAELREAELELVKGPPGAVFDVARALFSEGGLVFSTLSKASRARMLAEEGRIAPPLAPRKARNIPLDAEKSLAANFREILTECLSQLLANIEVILKGEDPEGPHQARIALRRLRAAIKMLGDELDLPAMPALAEEARWLGAEIGRIRDLDVVLDELVIPDAAKAPDEPGFADLIAALEHAGERERELLWQTLTGRRAQRFLLDLTEALTLIRDQPGPEMQVFAAKALETAAKKARKRALNIATLETEARHALRKKLKRLRYTAEFLAPLYGGRGTAQFLKRLKKLQTVFGDLNDAAMAEALFTDPLAPGRDSAPAMRAAGRVIGTRLERAEQAWQEAQTLWQAFEAEMIFWKD